MTAEKIAAELRLLLNDLEADFSATNHARVIDFVTTRRITTLLDDYDRLKERVAEMEAGGWVLMPAEPTRAMIAAMVERRGIDPERVLLDAFDATAVNAMAEAVADYRAMVASRPLPTKGETND